MPSRSFPVWPESIPLARDYVSTLLGSSHPSLCQTAALLVSELVTNAVRHAGGQFFAVEVRQFPDERRLWVGVTDAGSTLPVLRTPDVTTENGRGIQLVSTLADRWGAGRRRSSPEKTVWFELDYPSADPSR
jgi:anti-sigma regulatory factor (Ser/Thr protein kinase)